MENNGVRKGAWTPEEDTLLKNCIHMFGEGSWHKVPLRAGLNRCRKSCRLRWLNYLRPDINRGYFTKDEVDLLLRLHKLLGNRWSLIAGRLPGRTANDVKNFWNTHILKTSRSAKPKPLQNDVAVIKPRPRKLVSKDVAEKKQQPCSADDCSVENNTPINPWDDGDLQWWSNLLEMSNDLQTINSSPFTHNITGDNDTKDNGSTSLSDADLWALLHH